MARRKRNKKVYVTFSASSAGSTSPLMRRKRPWKPLGVQPHVALTDDDESRERSGPIASLVACASSLSRGVHRAWVRAVASARCPGACARAREPDGMCKAALALLRDQGESTTLPGAAVRRGARAAQVPLRDQRAAFKLLSEAAGREHVEAQRHLARCYFHGIGVAQEDAAAESWYLKAAENGSVCAQFQIGHMYMSGEGVQPNAHRAAMWIDRAVRAA